MSEGSKHPHERALRQLNEHYSSLINEHGDIPQAAQWRDRETQERRMEVLAEVGDLRAAKLLDFGCGTGHLLDFLRRRSGFCGEYVGYELSVEMIALATEKFPGVRFERRDVLSDGLAEDFDYMLMSGVFNNRVDDNWGLLTAILGCLFARTRKAIAFNAMSTYVDRFDSDLFYVSPTKVFQFCKEQLSPCVVLRHDYLVRSGIVPYEFTVYVYKTEIEPRKDLVAENGSGGTSGGGKRQAYNKGYPGALGEGTRNRWQRRP